MDTRKTKRERRAEAISEYKRMTKMLQEMSRTDDLAMQDMIKEDLDRCKELYPLVKKKLDGTTIDSRHVKELLNLCRDAAKRICVTGRPFKLKRIITNLMKDTESKNRSDLCKYVTENVVCDVLRTPPSFEFFYGSLREDSIEQKVRKQRQRLVTEDVKTQTAKERNIDAEVEQDSTPKEVELINQELTRLTQRDSVKFFQTLVDRQSFTQTVENLFHVSFLVKENLVELKRDSENVPVIKSNTTPPDSDLNQSILSFSMEDYRRWIER